MLLFPHFPGLLYTEEAPLGCEEKGATVIQSLTDWDKLGMPLFSKFCVKLGRQGERTLNLLSTVLPRFHTSKFSLYSAVCFTGRTYGYTLWPWSSWTANSDKKLDENKPCVTSRKTAFWKFCKIFRQFSICHKFW